MKGRWKKGEEGGWFRKERKGKGGDLGLCQPPIIPSGLLDFFYGWPPKQGLIKKEAKCCFHYTYSLIYSLSLYVLIFPRSLVLYYVSALLHDSTEYTSCLFPYQNV